MRGWQTMIGAATLILSLGTTAVASAHNNNHQNHYYRPQNNVVLDVHAPIALPNLGTGKLTFNLQQGAHSMVEGLVGTDVPYDYVVLDYNGGSVAYVDPFCAYR